MRIPTRADLTALLLRPLPYTERRIPIADPDPDPGVFGPGSVTWEVMAEPLLMLGAGRALLMQAAHPLVAEGAIEHSSYATDPFGRLPAHRRMGDRRLLRHHRRSAARLPAVNRLHVPVRGQAARVPTPRPRCAAAPGTAAATPTCSSGCTPRSSTPCSSPTTRSWAGCRTLTPTVRARMGRGRGADGRARRAAVARPRRAARVRRRTCRRRRGGARRRVAARGPDRAQPAGVVGAGTGSLRRPQLHHRRPPSRRCAAATASAGPRRTRGARRSGAGPADRPHRRPPAFPGVRVYDRAVARRRAGSRLARGPPEASSGRSGWQFAADAVDKCDSRDCNELWRWEGFRSRREGCSSRR